MLPAKIGLNCSSLQPDQPLLCLLWTTHTLLAHNQGSRILENNLGCLSVVLYQGLCRWYHNIRLLWKTKKYCPPLNWSSPSCRLKTLIELPIMQAVPSFWCLYCHLRVNCQYVPIHDLTGVIYFLHYDNICPKEGFLVMLLI